MVASNSKNTVGSTAFFAYPGEEERAKKIIEDSVPFIQSMAAQNDPHFRLDVATCRPAFQARLTQLFQTHASKMMAQNAVSFTQLWNMTNKPMDNKLAAYHRVGKYMGSDDHDARFLLMLDPDQYPENYAHDMREGILHYGTAVGSANKRMFQEGEEPSEDDKNIERARFEAGNVTDFKSNLSSNFNGFLNIIIDLNSKFIDENTHEVLLEATNKQLDRFLVGAILAQGGKSTLLDVDMYYEQNGIYGADKVSLDTELNMQIAYVSGMSKLDKITRDNKQALAARRSHDLMIDYMRQYDPNTFKAYESLSQKYLDKLEAQGFTRFWGEQVILASMEQIYAERDLMQNQQFMSAPQTQVI